jgi:hypothetical protein
MAGGKKRVEAIPVEWAELIRPRVEAGRRLKKLAAEVQRSRPSTRLTPPPP